MKIMLIGASGLLGSELQKLDPDMLCPSHTEVDITDQHKLNSYLLANMPDLIINCAAVIDNRVLEKQPEQAVTTNIIGAANVALSCLRYNIRMVYISTDYIYKGDRGNYLETDEILPFNFYAWTKLGGECSAKAVKNHLIIRTSFGPANFTYRQAFTDKWASKDYVDRIAPLIYEASVSPLTGVLNLGTDRKTLFDYAKERNPDVKPVRISDTNFFTPYDTSMNLQKWMDYKSSSPVAKPHTVCRACGHDALVKYLDLGLMPLANNLEYTSLAAKQKERYPLQVMLCVACGFSQLSVVIDPEKMFSYYTYRSSINAGYVKHCRQMAIDLCEEYGINADCFMIDIAGNDGALLKEFRDEIGLKVLNVDPATNLAAIAETQGIETIADFWDIHTAAHIVETHGKADIITATNVFAHVDDIEGFLFAASKTLADDGIMVIECPYLIDFIENFEFDTVYFEHLSYISIGPVARLCELVGLQVIDVSKQFIHGGSVRIVISKQDMCEPNPSVDEFITLEEERGYNTTAPYMKWSMDIQKVIDDFGNKLLDLKRSGAKIAGFAASAKGNTLLNSCGITTDIMDYIVDQTPEKIGKFSPGTGIPIVHPSVLTSSQPDYLVILSWNFAAEIMDKVNRMGFTGKFIIPIPEFKIID